jgi:hypothetical protein
MDNVLVSFMQDVAQGVYGESDLTYKEIHDFIEVAKPEDKRTVTNFREEWDELENEEINTSDLTFFVRDVIKINLVV